MHFHAFGLIHTLVSWTILTLVLSIAAWLTPGVSIRGGILSHFFVAGVLALVAWVVQLVVFAVAHDAGIWAQYSLGFVGRVFVLAFLLWLTSVVTPRLHIKSTFRALLAALIASVVTTFTEYYFGRALTGWLS